MKTTDFDYRLPPELIAQRPARPRDSARLMVVERSSGNISHLMFHQIGEHLRAGDCLVANVTKVLRSRIPVKRTTGGVGELLLLRKTEEGWVALARPYKRIKPAEPLLCSGHEIKVQRKLGDGMVLVDLAVPDEEEFLAAHASLPLPPYIRSGIKEEGEYQTVYARSPGSAAAPTAGLHFTEELLAGLKEKGVLTADCDLEIGIDTFRPIRSDDIEDHAIHSERYSLSPEEAGKVNRAKAAGGRIIAVGTTTARVLESCAGEGKVMPGKGETSLYITPGFRFNAVDMLITNFHLPQTSLLVMVAAFAGKDLLFHAYDEAIALKYRFFSFGDAMLIV